MKAIDEISIECKSKEYDFDEETLKSLGTDKQVKIITNYASKTVEAKLLIPYIEK